LHSIVAAACTQAGLMGLVDCPRSGNNGNLIITGQFFGASDAFVFIGSDLCQDVVHLNADHTSIQCTLRQGTALERPVFVIQVRLFFICSYATLIPD